MPSANAIHSGTAVSASEKLWMVSASSATDPETTTITSCATAVAPSTSRLILTARMPAALDSNGAVDAVGGVVGVRGEDLLERAAAARRWLCPWP